MVSAAHVAFTPAGNKLAPVTPSFKMPVAPVVAILILVIGVLMHTEWLFNEGVPTVLAGFIKMVPVSYIVPQTPINGIL